MNNKLTTLIIIALSM